MIVANHHIATPLIAKAVGLHFNPAVDICIARIKERDGEIITRGGIIIQAFTGASVSLHMAGFDPHWINSNLLWVTFDYPFNQLKIKKILCYIPSKNKRSLAINLRLGFIIEARIADVYPDDELVLTSMTRERCRWLNIKPKGLRREYENGQE